MPPSAPPSPPPPDGTLPSYAKWLGLGFLIYFLVMFGGFCFCSWRRDRATRALFDHIVERRSIDLEKFNGTECAICLESFEEEEEFCVLKTCNHGYHESCIKQWLSNWRTLHCPLCRRLVRVASVTRVPTY
ncbi:hypothetical protein ACJRO7_035463 [Eucalyptus globulus]|uniref:RING-type domain-containing protein n=1 Tax=Eucalyptus globulus TaxID=34317 RepID=A0ABD3JGI7_EUCGL